MSIKIMSWVLDHSPYTGKRRLVHLVLADHASDDGLCWPSQKAIARRAGCSVEYVRTTVKQMVADGYVQIVKASTREGSAHHYLLASPNDLGGVPKSEGGGPQIQGATSPNPSPSNRHESSKNRCGCGANIDERGRCRFCS